MDEKKLWRHICLLYLRMLCLTWGYDVLHDFSSRSHRTSRKGQSKPVNGGLSNWPLDERPIFRCRRAFHELRMGNTSIVCRSSKEVKLEMTSVRISASFWSYKVTARRSGSRSMRRELANNRTEQPRECGHLLSSCRGRHRNCWRDFKLKSVLAPWG